MGLDCAFGITSVRYIIPGLSTLIIGKRLYFLFDAWSAFVKNTDSFLPVPILRRSSQLDVELGEELLAFEGCGGLWC